MAAKKKTTKKKATKKKASTRKNGVLSREKGRAYEQKIVRILQEALPWADVVRGAQESKDHKNPDVMVWEAGASEERRELAYLIECRDRQRPKWEEAMQQAIDKQKHYPEALPMAITHVTNARESFVHLPLSEFLDWLK